MSVAVCSADRALVSDDAAGSADDGASGSLGAGALLVRDAEPGGAASGVRCTPLATWEGGAACPEGELDDGTAELRDAACSIGSLRSLVTGGVSDTERLSSSDALSPTARFSGVTGAAGRDSDEPASVGVALGN